MQGDQKFDFSITPEPRTTQVDVTQGNFVDVVFVVQNRSGRPVRVRAFAEALRMEPLRDPEPLAPEFWQEWLVVEGEPEWDFTADAVHRFTVRVRLPERALLGSYHFRLILSGVENPDEEIVFSAPVTFSVLGQEVNLRPLLLAGLVVLLVALVIGAVAAALLLRPAPRLEVRLEAPPQAVQGEVVSYTVTIENLRPVSATNVTLDYRFPTALAGATAHVVQPDLPLRYCDETLESLHCDLGVLGPNQTAEVYLEAIPGPGATTITNTQTVTVTGRLEEERVTTPAIVSEENTPVLPAPERLAVAIDPSTGTAVIDEPVAFRILAWSTITATQQVTFTYQLPFGMRYESPLPDGCSQSPGDYFNLVCSRPVAYAANKNKMTVLTVRAAPAEVSPALTGTLTASAGPVLGAAAGGVGTGAPSASGIQMTTGLAAGGLPAAAAQVTPLELRRSATTTSVHTALYFDGFDNWAELGFNQAPGTVTVELWVHPYSSDDSQNFIGAHRREPNRVDNVFLAGYYAGSLQVNVGGESHNLVTPKLNERYFLAVVVNKLDGSRSQVTVYVDGVEQEWQEPEEEAVCDRCKIFNAVLDGGETLPWVLGQDWDMGNREPRESDFFRGTLSEVRIWKTARPKDDILAGMLVRPHGDESDLAAYWRLDPVNPASEVLVDRVSPANNGRRFGAGWIEAEPQYGGALSFDGFDDVLPVDAVQLSDFQVNAAGNVEITMAGWVYVESVPTEEQWVLGSAVPTGTTLGLDEPLAELTESGTASAQSGLASAQDELIAALQASQDLDLDLPSAVAAQRTGRQRLFLALVRTFEADFEATAGLGPQVEDLSSVEWLPNLPAAGLGALARLNEPDGSGTPPASGTAEIANLALTIQQNLSRIDALEAEDRRQGQAAGSNVQSARRPQPPLAAGCGLGDRPDWFVHTVAAGDTLESLARSSGVPVSALACVNNLTAGQPLTGGQNLFLPVPGAEAPAAAAGTQAPEDQAVALLRELLQDAAARLESEKTSIETLQVLEEDQNQVIPPEELAELRLVRLREEPGPLVDEALGILDRLLTGQNFSAEILAETQSRLGAIVTELQQNRQNWVDEHRRIPPRDVETRLVFRTWIGLFDRLLAPIQQAVTYLDEARQQGIDAGSTAPALPGRVPPLSPEEQAELRGLQLELLILEERRALLENVLRLAETAEDNGQQAALDANLPGFLSTVAATPFQTRYQSSQEFTGALDRYPPYVSLRALARLDQSERDLVQPPTGAETEGLERVQAVQGIQAAQEDLAASIEVLRGWLAAQIRTVLTQTEPENLSPEQKDRIALLSIAQYNLEQYAEAEANLEAVQQAQDRVAAARQQVDEAQLQARQTEEINAEVAQAAAERRRLEEDVAQAELAVQTAASPEEVAVAQTNLAQARTRLNDAVLNGYASLQADVQALQVRETTLVDLDKRLELAVDKSVAAGVAAARRYSVERWIGPFLDLILGTSTPRQSAREAIRPDALLAAQQALKAQVDAGVDQAERDLNDALAEQNRLTNSGGNAGLRQQIIDQINAYLDSLNKDVTEAQQKLDEALEAQQGDQGDSDLPPVLAEALAQAVADQVAATVAGRMPIGNVRSLLTSSAPLEEQIRQTVKANIRSAVAAARRPVRLRLYYNTYYAILQLDRAIAQGTGNAAQRSARVQARSRLADLNLALLRILDAQNVLLQPGVGFSELIRQVADESSRASSLETLQQELQQALRAADISLLALVNSERPTRASAPGGTSAVAGTTGTVGTGTAGGTAGTGGTNAAGNTAGAGGTTSSLPTPAPGSAAGGGTAPGAAVFQPTPVPEDGEPGAPAGGGTPQEGEVPATPAPQAPLLGGIGQPGESGGTATGAITGTQATTSTVPAPVQVSAASLWAGLLVDSDGHVVAVARPQGAADSRWATIKDEKPLAPNQWIHFALVIEYRPGNGEVVNLNLYREGQPVKAQPQPRTDLRIEATSCNPAFYIGGLCGGTAGFHFTGLIDEVRLWNRVLSQAEILTWSRLPGVAFNEYAYWAFDDGPGRTSSLECPAELSCDLSPQGRFPVRVIGPAWVEADFASFLNLVQGQ